MPTAPSSIATVKPPSSTSFPSRKRSKASAATCASAAATLFDNATSIRLRFRHRYEVDPKYIADLESHGMIFSGKHPTQPIMQILELPPDVHPYFIGTQAHPE